MGKSLVSCFFWLTVYKLSFSVASVLAFVNSTTKLSDDKLFTSVMYNKQHVLHPTLPGTMDTKYHLRHRPHNCKLTANNRSITECDFIARMLFKDVCWHYALFIAILCIYIFYMYRLSFIGATLYVTMVTFHHHFFKVEFAIFQAEWRYQKRSVA